MKRGIIICFWLLACQVIYAQDSYRRRMIESVNQRRFADAAQEIQFVEDWYFDADNEADYINEIELAYGFDHYLDSLNVEESLRDSFMLYFAKECEDQWYYQRYIGDYSLALDFLELSADIKKRILGENHPSYAVSLNDFGVIYDDLGEFSKAEAYYLQSLEIKKGYYGENSIEYAITLCNLATHYQDVGEYSKAEACHLQALHIKYDLSGENTPEYAVTLHNLGTLYIKVLDYAKAESYLLHAVAIRKLVLGEEHFDYATSLNVLGGLYIEMGEYAKAETYLLQSADIWQRLIEGNHSGYAYTLNNLGLLYSAIGDISQAETYYLRALSLTKNTLTENHPLYATCLHNLGNLYNQKEDYPLAESYYVQALNALEAIYGKQHIDYAITLNALGELNYDRANYSQAEYYFLQALSIKRSVLGKDHPDCATTLHNLGNVYCRIRSYAKAESYLKQACTLTKAAYGETHPNYAITLTSLGLVYFEQVDDEKAEFYFTQVLQISKSRYIQTLNYMTDKQREHYWATIKDRFQLISPMFSYTCCSHRPSVSSFAYNNELFAKGVLLQSTEAIKRSIFESKDTTLIGRWNELTSLKQAIEILQEKDPLSTTLPQYEQEAEQLEKEITKASATYRDNIRQWNITWDSVRNHLTSDQLAIEFMSVPLSEDSTMYCALLLRKNSKYPELIPLFEEKEALSMWDMSDDWSTNDMYSEDTNGRKFSKLIWSKLLPYLKKGETVYFAATGILHQLAIEALPYDENHSMADMFNLVRVSSTREIVTRHDHSDNSTAVLYGGIQYDVTADTLLAQSQQYATMSLLASRGIDNDTTNRGTVDYLPGTKIEADSIQQILEKSNVQVQLFTSTNANEESFKALSGTHQNILHIGTHGFFWTDSTAQKKDYFSQRMIGMDNAMSAPPTIDPLNRCGLLFAGANLAMQGHSADLPEGVQDGILTAKEISLLDLRDADLVVLSACETGKGEITGDGVFGLQRAFKMAGARTIIMSLWPVSDQATQLFMTEFFRYWITNGLPKREAFRKAQNQVRQAYGEPIYWAGFIMLD